MSRRWRWGEPRAIHHLPELEKMMVGGGLVTMEQVKVVTYRGG